jgi:predicted dehydrogenase
MKQTPLTRRSFLTSAVTTMAAFTIVPRHVLGGPGETPPSQRLNIAGIGVGGKGMDDLQQLASENIVALCDVDHIFAAAAFKKWPEAKRHHDFRKMLETQKDIDAVVIATPDHLHYVMSMWAIKHGKNVYCQKPLTHTIAEARALAKAASQSQVATQMGNQGNAGDGVRSIQEWLEDGAIGAVREVHAWTNKPVWPIGMGRPTDTPPVPEGMDWDLWLGPAPYRPYHSAYTPFKWRAWWAFGSCALGDMGCHVLNTPWRALELGTPLSVEAYGRGCNEETGSLASLVYYEFPARGAKPPVKLTWYEGGIMPPRPVEIEDGRRLGDNEGCIFVGEKGKITCTCYGENARLLTDSLSRSYQRPAPRIPRSAGPYQEWLAASKGGPRPGSHFERAALLTEIVQLGNVAIRHSAKVDKDLLNGRPVKLMWDAAAGKTNNPEADQFLQTEYRKGWEV